MRSFSRLNDSNQHDKRCKRYDKRLGKRQENPQERDSTPPSNAGLSYRTNDMHGLRHPRLGPNKIWNF
jgi:hypothetical protein